MAYIFPNVGTSYISSTPIAATTIQNGSQIKNGSYLITNNAQIEDVPRNSSEESMSITRPQLASESGACITIIISICWVKSKEINQK